MTETSTFDIRNFVDKLEPTKQKNKYHCPACGGNDFEVEPNTGKYSCFHGCDRRDIREALKPWAEVIESRKNQRLGDAATKTVAIAPQKAKVSQSVIIPSGVLSIPRLSDIPGDIPQPSTPQFMGKRTRDKLASDGCSSSEISQTTVTVYDYGDNKKTHRYQCLCDANKEKGYTKTYSVSRIDSEGNVQWSKGKDNWDAYRQNEAIEALQAVAEGNIPVLLSQEGEKCVELGRAQKIPSITAQGSPSESDWVHILSSVKTSMGDTRSVSPLGYRQFILAHLCDNDVAGQQKAQAISKAAARHQIPFVAIDLQKIDPNLCKKGDIEQVLINGMTGDELVEAIKAEIERIRNEEPIPVDEDDDDDLIEDDLTPNEMFLQKVFDFLFGDKPWLSADDKLYRWEENYYKHVPDCELRPQIASYCNSFPVLIPDGKGRMKRTYPYANPAKVEESLKWAKVRVEKNPTALNPLGINCINGVVQVKWENGKPVRHFEEHDSSKHFFIYEPLIEYDPSADPTDCDRLLECLDKPQQEVLLRNLAASLDLNKIRKLRGREVKVLLACGLGSNGKDALRQTVSTIFGHQGMTSISLADFAHYDDGRKFALAPLLYSRVNWASENPQTAKLDKIQALKLFATGNKLHSERKGKDHIEFTPEAVGIFNLNEVPALQGTMQAIRDRLAVLEFKKTFKINPDPNNPNELQADPRFAYDEYFVQFKVAPAFLNKMLDALEALVEEGIDYECTTDAFKSMQKENNHLFQFCEDVGIDYATDKVMTAMEIWSYLEQWYIDNGTLTVDDGRKVWADQARPSDRNVKAINQVIPRFKQLFTKATLVTVPHVTGKRMVQALKGISIITPSNNSLSISEFSTPISEFPTPVAHQSPHQQTLINQDLHTNRTNFSNLCQQEKKEGVKASTILPSVLEGEEESAKLARLVCDDVPPRIPAISASVVTGVEAPLIGVEDALVENEPTGTVEIDISLIRLALGNEEAGGMLDELLSDWSEKRKAAARAQLTFGEIEQVRTYIKQYRATVNNSSPNVETTTTTVGDSVKLEIGDRVQWTGDAYDAAWGCNGVVRLVVFTDFDVEWTKPSGKSFHRREEAKSLRKP